MKTSKDQLKKEDVWDFIKKTNEDEYGHISPKQGKKLNAKDFHNDSLNGSGQIKHKIDIPDGKTIHHYFISYSEDIDDEGNEITYKEQRRDTYRHDGKGNNGKLIKREYLSNRKWSEI